MANENRVTRVDTPPQALQKLLSAHRDSLAKAVAANMNPDRLIRIAVSALHRNPAIGNCSIQSITNCVVLSGVMGLEPNTPLGHAYLIPYGKECTFQPGYRGLMHLAMRDGKIKKFMPGIVFDGDEFEQEIGLNEKFRHVAKNASDEWLGAYSFVRMADGEPTWIYLPKRRILEIRDRFSIGFRQKPESSPWTTSEDEMAIKTVIKRHIKRLDLTIDVSRAADLDDQAEKEGKQESIIDVEFAPLARDAEEADINMAGSREKQEAMRQEKIEALQKEASQSAGPPTEEEMDRATREAIREEAGEAKPQKYAFGSKK